MFTLTLVTPDKRLLTDVEIEELIVPAWKGQLDILPGHAPLMTVLSAGVLKVRLKGQAAFKSAAISWGYLEVNPKGVNVLADTAEWAEDVNRERAQGNAKAAIERLQQAGLSPDDYVLAQRKLAKEQARLDIGQDQKQTTH
jgi:F-type H+-transporting ATPase subunit epsilon